MFTINAGEASYCRYRLSSVISRIGQKITMLIGVIIRTICDLFLSCRAPSGAERAINVEEKIREDCVAAGKLIQRR